jgi:hypothetical protein
LHRGVHRNAHSRLCGLGTEACVLRSCGRAVALLFVFFYRNVSFYSQGGRSLVADHRITTAGFEHLLTNVGIAALLALVAALIYFRASPQPTQT